MKAPRFAYVRAESLAHALELLDKHGADARVLAGGQSLMPTLNMRLSQPAVLIDINRLEALSGISLQDGVVRIGALTRHVEVLHSPIVAQHLPLIAEAMPNIAHLAVRNRGTFGGSLANADPAAELPACAVALEATLIVESVKGRRRIAAQDFFRGLYDTAREPNELLTEIEIRVQSIDTTSVFMELSRRHGDYAMAGIACCARFGGEVIADLRLVYFGSEEKPTLAANAIGAVRGKRPSSDAIDAACAALDRDLRPMTNLEGDAAMFLHLQRVLTRRALTLVAQRARSR